MDMLDILKPQRGYVKKGTYRRYQTDTPLYFDYKDETEPTRRFGNVMENLTTDDTVRTIRTARNLDFTVGGLVWTQDGGEWTILSVSHEDNNAENLRFFMANPGSEWVLELQNKENPKDLR